MRAAALLRAGLADFAALFDSGDQFCALFKIVRGRFFQVDVLAGFERGEHLCQMKVIGRADEQGVYVFPGERLFNRNRLVNFVAGIEQKLFRAVALDIVDIAEAGQVGAIGREERLHHLVTATPATDQGHSEPIVRPANSIVGSSSRDPSACAQ